MELNDSPKLIPGCRMTSYNNDENDADRTPFQTAHDTQMLRISQREASRREEETKRRLLASRKLSLVVDLDQTIIHAAVDPTIAEWQKDKDNPNHEAVKDVRAFQLIDDGPGMRGCWYYIKLRPGLEEFLKQVSQIYELHIYTMGTRQYAEQIAYIVDPDRKFFGDRILSRDESGSVTNKNLERLFPIDTKMVVIIDDRGDVWKWNANLVRVMPFDFFVGIGDINSSFLPKKQEIKATPKPEKAEDAKQEDASMNGGDSSKVAEKVQDGAADGAPAATNGTDSSALEQLVAMGGGDDPMIREIQSKGQEETIAAQLEEKPLLQMQKLLDAKDQAAAAAAGSEDGNATGAVPNGDTQETNPESESSSSSEGVEPTPSPPPKPPTTRHSLLRDDDRELASLSARLTAVHSAFYNEYDRQRLGQKGGRVAALSGKGGKIQLQSGPTASTEDASDLLLVPDIKTVMPAMKQRVLSGVVIVFSGVLPLETNVQTADISLWAKTFGATIAEKVGRKVTHVVAARSGTSKVKQGTRKGLWVVGTQWLIDCMTSWKRVKEDDYVLEDLRGGMRKKSKGSSSETRDGADDRKELLEENRGFLLSSDEGEGETTGIDTEAETEDNRKLGANGAKLSDAQPERKRLKLETNKLADDEAMTTDNEDTVDRFMEDASPLSINQDEWADMDKELREFMGSDAETDSDAESVGSKLGTRKRKRDDDDESDTDGRPRHGAATVAATAESGSSLKQVNAASSSSSSIPTANHASVDSNNPIGDDAPNDLDPDEEEDDEETQIQLEQKQVEDVERQEEAEVLSSEDEMARELEREFEDSSGDDEAGFMGSTHSHVHTGVEMGAGTDGERG